jgi:hypothetical protein
MYAKYQTILPNLSIHKIRAPARSRSEKSAHERGSLDEKKIRKSIIDSEGNASTDLQPFNERVPTDANIPYMCFFILRY